MQVRTVAACALCVLIFASWVGARELAPFLAGGGDRDARYQAVVDGRVHAGLSTFSQDVVLSGCVDAMTSIYGRLQDQRSRESVRAHCLEEAGAVTAMAPTQSYAWFVRALAAAMGNDAAEMNHALVRARATGPFEQWIGVLRVDLAEDHRAMLDAANLKGNDKDLRMLVETGGGVRAIARRYLSQPDFRNRIAAIVAQLPQEDQSRFVRILRRTAQNMGLM